MLFLHCDFRASARLRLVDSTTVFGEKNLLKRDRLGLPHRRHGAALLAAASTTPSSSTARRAGTISTSPPCCCPPVGPRAEPHAPPRGPRWPRLPLHPLRRPRLHLLRRRPRAAHRRVGRRHATCNSATPSAPATTRKSPWRCSSASCAAPPARARLVLRPLCRLRHHAGGRAPAGPPLRRRIDKCPLAPNILRRRLDGAPWELVARPAGWPTPACAGGRAAAAWASTT